MLLSTNVAPTVEFVVFEKTYTLYGVVQDVLTVEEVTVLVIVDGPEGGDCPLAIAPSNI
jgi:hypothetical protein